DWIGIGNDGQDAFKSSISEAAGTTPERIAVHTVHQHDAPRCDLKSEYTQDVINRLGIAIKSSLKNSQAVTHVGYGQAEVYKVASNRKIYDENGLVKKVRFTATLDTALHAAPEGVIDPMVSMVSFWNGDKPIAMLSYYASHPQSYYRTGVANPDFPGVARFLHQLKVPDALHIYFTGAGGNIGAGKYNDASHENRGILAYRLADGMERAWKSTKRELISADKVDWSVVPVSLPADTTKDNSYVEKCKEGRTINIQCLALGRARILHLPGELFVEYQLAAKAMRPELFVAVAAYGEMGPGYIPTAIGFEQGGYEARVSKVTPEAEEVLKSAMHKLLNKKL
ncbi:hypothetical protein ACFLSA_06865, partial [Bacteroidota bacterium]